MSLRASNERGNRELYRAALHSSTPVCLPGKVRGCRAAQ